MLKPIMILGAALAVTFPVPAFAQGVGKSPANALAAILFSEAGAEKCEGYTPDPDKVAAAVEKAGFTVALMESEIAKGEKEMGKSRRQLAEELWQMASREGDLCAEIREKY